MGNINNICNVIKLDKHAHSVVTPTLLLKNRNLDVIGEIANFENWSISFRGDNIDEISFDVHKFFQKINSENDSTTLEKNPLWHRIVDLAIVDFVGYGLFEIAVTINEADTTVKSVVGQSLEVELGQTNLHDFHVNDDDTTGQIDYNDDYVIDDEGNVNFVPTVFCNFEDTKHSLLHRAIEKCPQWSIGHVPEYIAVNKKDKPEASFKFQRSYTVDGTSIYDFLVGDVAKESNVIFIFDTYNRKINCYNLEDYTWVSDDGKETIEIDAIGNDTTILIDGNNLVNDSTLSTNKDSIKNCFRVLGGDDYINAMVAVCNMTGDNYIYKFGSDQLEDMGKELSNALSDYNNLLESCQDEYYGSNTEKITIGDKEYDVPTGIFTKLAYLTDLLYEKQDTMMPGLVTALPENHVAKDEYDSMIDFFGKYGAGVFSVKDYSDTAFSGVTNNILSIAKIAVDARYTVEIVDNSTSYNSKTFKWSGKFKIYRTAKQEDMFISDVTIINVTDDNIEYSKQKCLKALAKTEISEVDFNVAEMNTQQRYEYFNKFALNRLKSFSDAYNSCLSILTDLKQENGTGASLYDEYYSRYTIINNVMKVRQVEVDDINKLLTSTRELQSAFFEKVNLKKFLENKSTDINLYNLFCSYRREDDYQNDNYISDGLTDAECIEKAKELLDVAKEEINIACEPNRTISENINNIFTISDFEKLYDKFSLYNYIRAEVDGEIYKLRILDIEFNSESPETLNVTFAENIESIDGTISETQDTINKANSMATSYSSTMLQAKNGNEANKNIKSIYKDGLCATSALLKNSDDAEVEFSQSGIICKQITDDDNYSLKQLRVTPKGIYLTEDNWENLSEAIGEIAYTDPITGENKVVYGVIADSIVGNFLASEKAYIGNTSGSVIIDSDGITLDGGSIRWKSKLPSSSIDGLDATIQEIANSTKQWDEVDDSGNKINISLYGYGLDGSITGSYYVYSDTLMPGKYYLDQNTGYCWKCTNYDYVDNKRVAIFGYRPTYMFSLKSDNAYKRAETAETNAKDYANSKIGKLDGCVADYLGIGGTTIVSDKYVISPYLGGGYLNISDSNNRVIIDPKNLGNTGYIFRVQNSSGVSIGFDFDGNAVYNGSVTATSGTIGGWNIGTDALSYGDLTSNNYIKFDSINKSIISQNGSNKCVLTSGYLLSTDGTYSSRLDEAGLVFSKDNTQYARFSSTYWSETSIRGVAINSYADSKFISFGNKNDNSESSFTTSLVLNYGLNPNSYTEDILIYGTVRALSGITFSSGTNLNGLTGGGIYCSGQFNTVGKICAGNTSYGDYMLNVNGNAYVNGSTYVNGDLKVNNVSVALSGHNLWDHTITWTDGGNARVDVNTADQSHYLSSCQWVTDNFTKKSSDERVKQNFTTLPNNIDNIFYLLHPIQYEFKDGLNKNGYYFGETAQHIEKIFNDNGLNSNDYAVIGRRKVDTDSNEDLYIKDDDFHYIDIDNIVWMCVDQIQKLKSELNQLKSEIYNTI